VTMSLKMNSFDVSYSAPSKSQRRRRSTRKRKVAAKRSNRTPIFGLALSAGIIGSLGVITIAILTLMGL